MKKILKIEEPWIRYNQDYAFPSAIMSSDESYRNWVCSNLVQLYYIQDREKFSIAYFYLGRNPNPINFIPLLSYQEIHKQHLKQFGGDAIGFLHTMLDEGYYIACLMDEYYILSRNSYQKNHFEHGVMIYGYDDGKQVVYITGYCKNGYFESQEIPYGDFVEAFWNVRRVDDFISCFKRNKKKYELDTVLMKDLLYDYIHAKNTSNHYRMVQNPLLDCKWGIEACTSIIKEGSEIIDVRYLYTIYEHIRLMRERFDILVDRYECRNEKLRSELIGLENRLNMLVMIGVKYKIKRDPTQFLKIKQNLMNLIAEEKNILQTFYDFIP